MTAWRARRAGVSSTPESPSEVAALHRLVDVRPLDLEKLRASIAAQSARDPLSDLYVEPAHPRRIPRVGLDEWRTALGIAAPDKDRLRRMLNRREAERECGDHAERATA